MEKTNTINQNSNKSPQKKSRTGVFSYLRFGESYTSLILGIVVVIIATVLFLGIVRARNIKDTPRLSEHALSTQMNQGFQNTLETSPGIRSDSQPAIIKPTSIPSIAVSPASSSSAMKEIKVEKPSKLTARSKLYAVEQGDDLWNIAVKKYQDGYKWVDIARANKLSNPDLLVTGQKISLPDIDQKNTTNNIQNEKNENKNVAESEPVNKITESKYVVKVGENLWDIALRAFGDGYKWVDIARANNLSNPDLILIDQSLVIPRK